MAPVTWVSNRKLLSHISIQRSVLTLMTLKAEEVQNASTVVPWVMICTILINGTLGFATIIAFNFCIGDLRTAISSPTGYDFIEVFYNATNSHAATSVMTSVLITLVICATFGLLASASRQTWAFARDRGLPCSEFLAYVSSQSS